MLTLNQVTKDYGEGEEQVHALRGVSIHFRPHEFVAILGPSGCGKTTLLNIIGGLDQYTDGDLVIAGTSTKEYKDKDWDAYRNHRVGFIFQSYNLIPHQTVLSNVELALTLSGVSKAERHARATAALQDVGLSNQVKKKPTQMSGGQMQRVAIARALVNNPDIILADEPTGALDTVTSVQIMDILSGISSEKLIVMVTHNPELAEKYATRIIRVLDGEVVDDTNPYDGVSEEATVEASATDTATAEMATPDNADTAVTAEATKKKKAKRAKTSMSFMTALTLSLNNLLTKKTRTFLTSFAGSIGIIGIALILALSNGIQVFIDKVQEDTLSSYPIGIEESSVDLNSMLTAFAGNGEALTEPEDGYIYSNDQIAGMAQSLLSGYRENDLEAFKKYLDSDASHIKDNAVIQYRYSLTPQIYTKRDGEYMAVSPSKIFDSLVGSMGMDSSMVTMNVWDEMIDNQDLLNSQYDLLEGSWPTAYNEVVLVADKDHRISDLMLYALGIKDPDEFIKLLNAKPGEETGVTESERYTYEQLMSTSFRMVMSADYYEKQADGTYRDLRKSDAALTNLLEKRSVEVKVVGIIAANPDATATSVSGVVGYTAALTDYIMEKTMEQDEGGNYKYAVVGEQLANPDKDVISGKPFAVESTETDEQKTAELIAWLANPTTADTILAEQYEENLETMVFTELFQTKSMANMMLYLGEDEATLTAVRADISDLLTRDATLLTRMKRLYPDMASDTMTAEMFISGLSEVTDKQTLLMILSTLQVYEGTTYDTAVTNKNNEANAMSVTDKADAYRTYANGIITAAEASDNYTSAGALWDTYRNTGSSDYTYKQNLRRIGIADKATPTAIYIYPKSFDAKEAISAEIADYNAHHENGEITYTDYIGIMLKSVSTILKVITYVLVAFVGISLLVSSIMIGIITYISVLERIKEIGILRAIGASKRDVSHVFLAETLIVGFTAGAIGIVFTLVLCIPVNIIIRALSGFGNIGAQLPFLGAVILIAISMLLTLVAGLIPARIAAKKEPVEALRSE